MILPSIIAFFDYMFPCQMALVILEVNAAYSCVNLRANSSKPFQLLGPETSQVCGFNHPNFNIWMETLQSLTVHTQEAS